ncbi:efflux RND transporter permease subunit, partial [Erwinia amylovora]|uniref:efflux RND transporter permease subunit n=1 Tax=Erwinia amylovora TaxID=552 RepID=UPI00200B3C1A
REAIANSTTNKPKGMLSGDRPAWMVDSNGQRDRAEQFRDLVVSYRDGRAIRLRDVATVSDAVEDKYNVGYYTGVPSVMIGVTRSAGANMLETI